MPVRSAAFILDGVSAKVLARDAYSVLGDSGKIPQAAGHQCNECSQPYMANAPWVQANRPIDPGAVLGLDNAQTHTNAPAMQHGDAAAGGTVRPACWGPDAPANVTMHVVDGIVMGNTVSYPFYPCTFLHMKLALCC